jgi:hypothetical protein
MYRLGMAGLLAAVVAVAPNPGPKMAVSDDSGSSWLATAESSRLDQKEWDWKGQVARGKTIEIKGVNGEIHAERSQGSEVEVRAVLSAKKSDPNSVRMEVVEHEDGVTICAVYPSKGDRPNECRPGGKGRMNVKNNDVQVNFSVRVPAGVGFIGRTVNGEIGIRGIDGDVTAHTVNGDVDISASGLAAATTVNGSITVSMGRADWRGTLRFTTVNGSVTLEMPADLNSDVSVSTVNGHISSDFPLTVEGRFSPRHLKGTIGTGGRTLVVKTVNGNVQIRRS